MSAQWPTAVVTTSQLYVAVNELQNNLSAGVNSAVTTIPLNSATGFPSVGLVLIDNEVIQYTSIAGNSLTGCTRAFDGTTAAAHSSGAIVSFAFCAAHYNNAANEIIAVETSLNFTASKAMSSDSSGRLAVATTTLAELNFVAGVTSAIQTQLNAKAPTASPTFSGTITTPLTASRAVTVNASSQFAVSTCTSAELDFVHGVTSAIQTQLDGKASTSGTLLTTTDQTATGIKTFSGQLIGKGTATNDDAAAGYIGEYVSSYAAGINGGATGAWADMTSISLTAGDWDVSGCLENETSSGTTTNVLIGISTHSGNDATGLQDGDSRLKMAPPPTSVSMSIPSLRFSFASTTTVYLKHFRAYSGGAPSSGRISARRIR